MSIRIDGTNTAANPGITGADADTGLQFGTDEIQLVTGGTNRATVESNGNFTIEDGNLVVAAGHGIDFSSDANAAGMTSELLDDYEEGTFTPTLNATSINVTYSVQDGWYTKIGRTVFFTLQINLSSVTSRGTGNFIIDGLPFAVTTGAYRYVVQTKSVNFDATKYSHYAYNPGGTKLQILYTTDNGSWTAASTTNFAITSLSIISVTGFYKV